jgi:hypothetical protein
MHIYIYIEDENIYKPNNIFNARRVKETIKDYKMSIKVIT